MSSSAVCSQRGVLAGDGLVQRSGAGLASIIPLQSSYCHHVIAKISKGLIGGLKLGIEL